MKIFTEEEFHPDELIYLKGFVDQDGNNISVFLYKDSLVLKYRNSGLMLQIGPVECLTFANVLMGHAHRILLDLTEEQSMGKIPPTEQPLKKKHRNNFSVSR